MKKFTLILAITLITTALFAQINDRRGYIGITVGPSIAIGDFSSKSLDNNKAGFAKTGLNIGLVNFGYRLGENFGLTALWFGAAHKADIDGFDATWSYGGLMGGGMFTIPINNKFAFDLKAMAGFVSARIDAGDWGDENGDGAGFDFGAVLRYHFTDRWSVLMTTDFFTSKPDFDEGKQTISTININAGLAYRFR